MQERMKNCEKWNVEINRRTRKRKKVPGEMEADAAITAHRRVRASNEVWSRHYHGWLGYSVSTVRMSAQNFGFPVGN